MWAVVVAAAAVGSGCNLAQLRSHVIDSPAGQAISTGGDPFPPLYHHIVCKSTYAIQKHMLVYTSPHNE